MAVYLYPIYCLPLPHLLSTFWLFFLIYCLPFISEDTVQNCHTRRRIKHGKLAIWKYIVMKNIKKMSKAKSKIALLGMDSVIILFVLIAEKHSQLFSLFCLHIINFKLHFVNFALILACCIGYGIFYGCFSFSFGSS